MKPDTNSHSLTRHSPRRYLSLSNVSVLAVTLLWVAVLVTALLVLVGKGSTTVALPQQTVSCTSSTAIPDPEPPELIADCETLLGLMGTLAGTNTAALNWSEDTPISDWTGVTVASNRVTHIDLGNVGLTGSIPGELGSLTNLRNLHLGGNQLTGTIPTQLGSLTNLLSLTLSTNKLSGSIPTELGNLTNLQRLFLGSNKLTGGIPGELGSLTNLEQLVLQRNPLSGTIPTQLGSLTNLLELNLSESQLTGSIPVELGNLTKLESLTLQDNVLTGTIPSQLGGLTNLKRLNFNENQLSGGIPIQFGGLENLETMEIAGNNLMGSIPTQLGSLTNLRQLYLSHNQLSGSIPTQLGSLTNLERLNLQQNGLTGSIPIELGLLTELRQVYLGNNQLSGSIPPELGSLAKLWQLFLEHNRLSGSIPPELDNLVPPNGKLRTVRIATGNPDICGPIPPALHGLAPTPTTHNDVGTAAFPDGEIPCPGVSYERASYTVTEGGSVIVKVTLSADVERPVTIPITSTPQGGATSADFSGVPASLTFNSGDTEQSFTFSAAQDDDDDDGESVKLAFGTLPTGVNAGTNSEATVSITDDDGSTVTVSYEQASYTVAEGDSDTVKVTLSADPERTVTIPIASTLQGGATAADFSGVPARLTFNSGETEKSFTFMAVDDTVDDDGESVKLAFGTLPTGVNAGTNSEATVNITDDDLPAVTVSYEQSSYTVAEGASDTVKVTLSADPERTVTIPIAKTNQGDTSDADYSGVPVSVTFNSGETEQSFTFMAVDDTVDDDGESVKLAFGTLPTGVTAGTTTEATVSITDDDVPAVTVSYEQSSYTVAEGDSDTVKVTLSADPERTVTIPIAKTNQGDTSDADYSGVPVSVTFNSGETEQSFTFMAVDDTVDDDDESVLLAFGTLPAGVTAGATSEATVNITDDDLPTVTVSYEQSSYTVSEDTIVTVKVILSADPERTVTVPITKTNQGGASDADYSGVPVSVTFNSGETEKSFTFSAAQDTDDDDGESVKLAFGTLPAGVTAGATSEATVNITDDDVPTVTVSYEQASYTVAEGGSVSVKVTLSADPERTVTVPIASTLEGGASAADYSVVPASLTFNSGETEKSFTFTAVNDTDDDDDESVKLAFGTLPTGVSAGATSEATFNITDDDDPTVTVSYEQSSYTVAEGDSDTVKVTLSADPERTVTIPITRTPQGGATAADFSGVPVSVTFNSGETEKSFTFSAAQDEDDDDGESVKLAFGTLPTGVNAGATSEATVNITDDDVPTVTVSYEQASYTVSEDTSVTVKVILSADPERTVTIPIAKTNQGDTSDADYSGVPVSVTFNSGETEKSFTFMAVDDTDNDDGESVKLAFGTLPTGVTAGTTSEATVNITDDDLPTVAVSYEQSSYTASEDSSVTVKVILSADPERTVTIPITRTLQGGATAADFTGVPASLTFNSGETEKSFTFSAAQDDDNDDGESVKLAFGTLPAGVTAGTTSEATVNITDDDLPTVAVSYEQSSYTVSEDSSVTVKVILSADPERTVTIPITRTPQGGATAADFSGVPASLTFNSGDTEKSFTFSAAQDDDNDDGESVKLAFGTLPAGVNAGTTTEATVNITDDDLPTVAVSFEQASYTVSEDTIVTVKVILSADPERTVTIPIQSTLQGGASDTDYSGVPVSVTFNSGETEKSFTFSAAQDDDDDDGESVQLTFGTLPAGVNAGANSEATVNITDEDVPAVTVSFEQASYTVSEDTIVTVKVILSADPERTVTIPIESTLQGGASDADYSGVPGGVTFNSGETEQSFTFTAVDDTDNDDGESVQLAFGTLPAGVSAGANSEATVNITDDDLPFTPTPTPTTAPPPPPPPPPPPTTAPPTPTPTATAPPQLPIASPTSTRLPPTKTPVPTIPASPTATPTAGPAPTPTESRPDPSPSVVPTSTPKPPPPTLCLVPHPATPVQVCRNNKTGSLHFFLRRTQRSVQRSLASLDLCFCLYLSKGLSSG